MEDTVAGTADTDMTVKGIEHFLRLAHLAEKSFSTTGLGKGRESLEYTDQK